MKELQEIFNEDILFPLEKWCRGEEIILPFSAFSNISLSYICNTHIYIWGDGCMISVNNHHHHSMLQSVTIGHRSQ